MRLHRLNIFYLLLEKVNTFAEGKYDVSVPAEQIASDFEEKRGDAMQRVEALNITKRIISTCTSLHNAAFLQYSRTSSNAARMVQANRSASGGATSLGRSATASSTSTAASRSPSSSSFKKAAPPPPSAAAAAPPPYSPPAPGSGFGAAAVAKKAPPPPPPLKPKPKPAAQYVVALYDFAAQADGDLDFKAGDRIEVVERTDSTEDWWTGKLNGRQGVFPGAIAHMRGLPLEIEANGSRVTSRKLCPGGMRHKRC